GVSLRPMPESEPAGLVAQGSFVSVAATPDGPPLAYASRAAQGANAGHGWDLAAGRPLGAPIPDFPADGTAWAFGAPAGSPVVAWTHRDRVHVHDLGTGHELSLDGQPELLGLAVHGSPCGAAPGLAPASRAEGV